MTRRVSAILLVTAAALGAAHMALWRSPVQLARPVTLLAEQTEPAPAPPRLRLEGQPLDAFRETASRPLFWSSRRPQGPAEVTPVVQAIAPVAPAVPPAQLRLAGTMVEGERHRRALLVLPGLAGGGWFEEGMEIEGWRLTRIEASFVRLEAGGRKHDLKLE